MQLENTKNQESLDLRIQNDMLNVQNNALNPIKILEFRSIDKNTDATRKIEYGASPLTVSNTDKQLVPADFTETTFSGKKITAITELGNVFTAVNLDDLPGVDGRGAGNGTAMINGMGLNSRIIQLDYFGRMTHGQGIAGSEDSLKPYTAVPSTTDYAAELLASDSKTTMPITGFNAEYQYTDGNIQFVGTTTPNILSYSQSRTVAGSGMSMQMSSGITFSGAGKIIVKLNDLGAQTLRLDGTVPSGAKLRLVEQITNSYDLMTAPYDGAYGFNVGGGIISASGGGYPSPDYPCYRYQNNYATQIWYGSWVSYAHPNLIVSSLGNFATVPGLTVSGTQNANSYTVNSVSSSYSFSNYCAAGPPGPNPPAGSVILYYDKDPVADLLVFVTNFVSSTVQTAAGRQYYLIAEPNGGTITVTGTGYNPTAPYLKITNLPSNIPYEIVKDGYVSASGMGSESGSLTLLLTDVNISGTQGAATTGTLYLYPDSLAYRGSFSTVVFDNINDEIIHIQTADHKVYVVHAYVQIPVTGSVSVTNTNLGGGTLGTTLGALPLQYLNGNYSNGDLIKVPVIPGYLNIDMDINGIPTTTTISNVLGGTGIKVANPATQTINDQDNDSPLLSIEATTGTVAYAIATTSGSLNANLLATISGSSSLTNTVTLTSPPPPPASPARKDPLTGWVDVYKNGVLIQSVQLFFDDQPTFTSSNVVSGNSQVQTASYSYAQTTISGTTVTGVAPGDMIEYYLYAKIHADGIPLTPPSGYAVSAISSRGIATATIHSGNVHTSS